MRAESSFTTRMRLLSGFLPTLNFKILRYSKGKCKSWRQDQWTATDILARVSINWWVFEKYSISLLTQGIQWPIFYWPIEKSKINEICKTQCRPCFIKQAYLSLPDV